MDGSAGVRNTQLQNGRSDATEASSRQCTFCRKPSVCCCNRCGDFYCSPDCQRRDWPSHRYICLPMPPLVHLSFFLDKSTHNSEIPTLAHSARTPHQNFNATQHEQSQNIKSAVIPHSGNANALSKGVCNEGYGNKQRFVAPSISPLPKDNSCVLITGFRSPNRCYVRALTAEENDGFLSVLQQVDTYGKTAAPLTKLPKPNTYAIARLNETMHRVEVLSARNAKNIRVFFCDNGVTGVRQLSDLHEIPEEILRLRQHAVMVQLRNVENYTIKDKLTKFLSKFENKEFKIKFGPDDERGGNVELLLWQSEISLNEEIVKFCKNLGVYAVNGTIRSHDNGDKSVDESPTSVGATANTGKVAHPTTDNGKQEGSLVDSVLPPTSTKFQNQIESPVVDPPFETHTFKEGSTKITALVVDDSCLDVGYFGCIAKSDFGNLLTVQKYLDKYQAKQQLPYKPKLNEYCIAKFEKEWYRAKVIEIVDESRYTVVYVDFTNEGILTSTDIRRYPIELKNDCRTNLCLLVGLPNLTKEQLKFLKNTIKMQETIDIDKVVGVDEGIILVDCQNVLQKCLAIKTDE